MLVMVSSIAGFCVCLAGADDWNVKISPKIAKHFSAYEMEIKRITPLGVAVK